MPPRAKPQISFSTRVSPETDERRRRLQEQTGLPVSQLVEKALRHLEENLAELSEPTA
jgi:hypothetical protein